MRKKKILLIYLVERDTWYLFLFIFMVELYMNEKKWKTIEDMLFDCSIAFFILSLWFGVFSEDIYLGPTMLFAWAIFLMCGWIFIGLMFVASLRKNKLRK